MYAVCVWKPEVVTVVSLCIKGKLFYSLQLYIGDEDNLRISSRILSRFSTRLSLRDAGRRDRLSKRRFGRCFE